MISKSEGEGKTKDQKVSSKDGGMGHQEQISGKLASSPSSTAPPPHHPHPLVPAQDLDGRAAQLQKPRLHAILPGDLSNACVHVFLAAEIKRRRSNGA